MNHFEILVTKDGKFYFSTSERSATTAKEAMGIVEHFRKVFPVSEGYDVSCLRWETSGKTIRFPEIMNKVFGYGAHNWLIREARSMKDAEYAISIAMCTGSVGSLHKESFNGGDEIVVADVVRLNDDGTECKPS